MLQIELPGGMGLSRWLIQMLDLKCILKQVSSLKMPDSEAAQRDPLRARENRLQATKYRYIDQV